MALIFESCKGSRAMGLAYMLGYSQVSVQQPGMVDLSVQKHIFRFQVLACNIG